MDLDQKIKFAVIGCGNIGKRHVAVIDADERAELVAICDTNTSVRDSIAKLYNVKSFDNHHDLLKTSDADLVCICTPHGLHVDMAIDVAKAKKHILVEKPMALTIADCNRMIEAAKQNNVELMVVKQNRYNAPIALTKQALDKGKLGKVYMVQCNVIWNRNPEYYSESQWRGKKALEGGALYTQVSHFIDLLIWWFGDVVDARTYLDTKLHHIEIEDCGQSMIKFQTGVLGSLLWTTCTYNKNYEGSITIIGENGTIKIGGAYLNKIEFWDIKGYPLPTDVQFTDKPNEYGKYQGTSSNHDKVVTDVIRKLLNERHNVVEGDEGLKTTQAIELIYSNRVG